MSTPPKDTLLFWAGQLEGMAVILRKHKNIAEAIFAEQLARDLIKLGEQND